MISIKDTNADPRALFWKYAKYVSFISPIVLSGIFFGWFRSEINFDGASFWFSLSACATALILAGTYYFAYRFFEENFYFFIFVSWIANALYLVPDLNHRPLICSPSFFYYKLFIFLLSLTSSAFLLLSLFTRATRNDETPTWKRVPKYTWVAIALLSAFYLIFSYLQVPHLPTREVVVKQIEGMRPEKREATTGKNCDHSAVFPHNEHIELTKWMIPGSVVAFALLLAVGSALRTRLQTENPGWKDNLLESTFWIYGLLQFTYPFTLSLRTHREGLVMLLYLIAQLAKVGNAISMVGIFQSSAAYRDSNRSAKVRDAENEVRFKQAELLAREERLLRESNFTELGRLASAIKHDVLTPLATMGFDVKFLKEQLQHEPKLKRRLENINESMARIEAIVKVVDFFRGDKVFFDRDEHMRKASMLEIAHRAVRSVKHEREDLKQDNPTVRIKVSGKDLWVRANMPMLEQLVVNVIKNGLEAIDGAKRETGLIQMSVGIAGIQGSEYSRWVKLEIEDNGEGIPAENMDKLTTVFTTRSDKKPNSGIGLFIGKKILDIHDGILRFESKVNEGTKVTVLLPEWQALQKHLHDTGGDSTPSHDNTHDVPLTKAPSERGERASARKNQNLTEE